MAQRRSLIALLALGSTAAVVSCGGTDLPAPATSSAAVFSDGADGGTSPGDEDEDGGVHEGHGRLHARVLLVRGGTATFIGLSPRVSRCLPGDPDAGEGCPERIGFSGSVIVEGAAISVLGRRTPESDDGGTVGEADGGSTGIPIDAHQALVLAEHSRLVLPRAENGDGGIPGTTPDGGVSSGISARLHGGRIVVVLGTNSGGDAGVVEDGGVSGGGGSRTLRHIRDIRFEGSVLRFVPGPTHNPDGG